MLRVVFVTAVVLCTLPLLARAGPFHAASCVLDGIECTPETAARQPGCVPNVPPSEQAPACLASACAFCARPAKASLRVCRTRRKLESACALYNNGGANRTTYGESDCVWTAQGNGQVVVPLIKLTPANGWTPVYRDGMKGLTYKADRDAGIAPAGRDKMCFRFRAPKAARYFMNALTWAPTAGEHNDAWVNSDTGFEVWQAGSRYPDAAPYEFLKAYQNNGRKGISDSWKTVDHNGHRFTIPYMEKDEVRTVCISGRSFRYEVYKIVFRACKGMAGLRDKELFCDGRYWKLKLEKAVDSVCVA